LPQFVYFVIDSLFEMHYVGDAPVCAGSLTT
jgi:hypothetical protein